MATLRANFSQLLAPGLMKVMFEWLKEHPEEYSQFLEVETMTGAYLEHQMMAGLGLVKRKPEGEGILYDDPIQGPSKRYIPDGYALGWQITKEMWDDDKYSIMRQMPKELMKSMRQTVEQIGANILNLGFSTVTSADGVSFFNTAHPLLGGGTAPNRLPVDVTPSVQAFQDAIILYENTVNDRGLKMRLTPNNLWLGPANQFVVGQILNSEYAPFTGNNEVNTMQGRFKPRVLHYLTNPNAWFLSSDEHNEARFIWRQKPLMDSTDDFETKGTKHSIFFRVAAGVTDWRGWFGSNP